MPYHYPHSCSSVLPYKMIIHLLFKNLNVVKFTVYFDTFTLTQIQKSSHYWS